MANHFSKNFSTNYFNIDLLESLYYSAIYLVCVKKKYNIKIFCGKRFIPKKNYKFLTNNINSLNKNHKSTIFLIPSFLYLEFGKLINNFSIVINNQSLSEMSENQVESYLHFISRKMKNGIFYEQKFDHSNKGNFDLLDMIKKYFKFHFMIDSLGVSNPTAFYSEDVYKGMFEMGRNANLFSNCNLLKKLERYRKRINVEDLVNSFHPISKNMTRLSMRIPNLNHKKVKKNI